MRNVTEAVTTTAITIILLLLLCFSACTPSEARLTEEFLSAEGSKFELLGRCGKNDFFGDVAGGLELGT